MMYSALVGPMFGRNGKVRCVISCVSYFFRKKPLESGFFDILRNPNLIGEVKSLLLHAFEIDGTREGVLETSTLERNSGESQVSKMQDMKIPSAVVRVIRCDISDSPIAMRPFRLRQKWTISFAEEKRRAPWLVTLKRSSPVPLPGETQF